MRLKCIPVYFYLIIIPKWGYLCTIMMHVTRIMDNEPRLKNAKAKRKVIYKKSNIIYNVTHDAHIKE